MKAGSFRPSIDIKQPAWAEGPPVSTMVSLARYWAEAYDWMAVQSQINNNFSHYMATVPPAGNRYNESLDLHFIHQRSKRENAVPILMIHGWPSSSLEWQKVIPGLVDPADDSKPAFHVVAPDLPGYGFSPAPTAPDLGASGHSAAFANLMEQLGYERYAVYSTDIGFVIGRTLVQDYAPRIINHVTDFYVVSPDDADMARYATSKTTPEETAYMRSYNAYFATHSAYIALHSTLPLSVAHALNDSPVGFLAWIYQIIYTASDQTYTASELVTQALLLYINGVYGNIRSYVELPLTSDLGPENRTTVPTSVLQFGSLNAYPELSSFNYVVSYLSTTPLFLPPLIVLLYL